MKGGYDDNCELKISVVICTYRRSTLLIRLLDSIKQQRYKNTEIIISDDASNDDTEEVVRRYIHNNTKGQYNNTTGQSKANHTIFNLESKEDIYQRLKRDGLLDNEREWYYRNIGVTASQYLAKNKTITKEDKIVWRWVKDHFDRLAYYQFVLKILKKRKRYGLPISFIWIKP